jgi:patatin-like phospholipase/acyl hydrolase
MRNIVKILSIDGGGIRGIIPATILAVIERKTGRPVSSLFDLIAGTSTGGMLSLLLTKPAAGRVPAYTAQDAIDLYAKEGPRIFSRSFWHRLFALDNFSEEKYPSTGIESVLAEYFGSARLRDALTDVLVTSYEIERSFPFFFKSSVARTKEDHDFPMKDVARATSAAPTYFEPLKLSAGNTSDYYTLVDGGVFANNPSACALVEARTTYPEANQFLVVSLGTGNLPTGIPYSEAKNWGIAQWVRPIFDVVLDGVSSTVDYQLRQLMPPSPEGTQSYYRMQATLTPETASMDDASAANITALKGLAGQLIEQQESQIDSLCESLTKPD